MRAACAWIERCTRTHPPDHDSLIGKLIVHGKTRAECLMRLRRSLDEFVVDGIERTLPLFRALAREQDIIERATITSTGWSSISPAAGCRSSARVSGSCRLCALRVPAWR